jgi:hypothetical protein
MSACQTAIAAGESLDVIGRQVVQLFHHTNIGGFLLLPLECGKKIKVENCFFKGVGLTVAAIVNTSRFSKGKVKGKLLRWVALEL